MPLTHPKDAVTREAILEKVMLKSESEINQAVDSEVALMEVRLESEEAEEAEIVDAPAE